MLNQGLGDSLIQGLGAQSSVGVLGAGAGAETLAFSLFCKSWISTRWSHPQPFRPSGLGCSASTVLYWQGPRDYGNASKKIDSFIQDVVSLDALNLLSRFVPSNDLIFCPAIYTELEAKKRAMTSSTMFVAS